MKLSERSKITNNSQNDDFLHIVRNGASYAMTVSALLNNSYANIRSSVFGQEMIIFRKDKTINNVSRILQEGDFVIFVDTDDKNMIIGMATDVCNTFPTDLRDSSKFMNFFEADAAL